MDSTWVAPLDHALQVDESLLGGKTATLARLRQTGLCIADGFFLTTDAYRYFVNYNALEPVIALELGRKPLELMRWEELWDAALRIRSAFLTVPIPPDLATAISAAHSALGPEKNLAVRSSAPGEDSTHASFAGMHESVLDVTGSAALLHAVRIVWASLWSDAALLYRRELALDPLTSSMAVLVQEVINSDVSGVIFSHDPTNPMLEHIILEAVPGRCSELVDGLVDPDRWRLSRLTGDTIAWKAGCRDRAEHAEPLLEVSDLKGIWNTLQQIETVTGDAVDVEWTGRHSHLTILQARPISTLAEDGDKTRRWYLSLRPARKRLKLLSNRVSNVLIPELEALGHRFMAEKLSNKEDAALAAVLTERLEAVEHWRKVYWDEFIPFAHGVRQLATYYNDSVRPQDPYEFIGLLRGENLLSFQRNRQLEALATLLVDNPELSEALHTATTLFLEDKKLLCTLEKLSGGTRFIATFSTLLKSTMNITYGEQRLATHPEQLLQHLFEMERLIKKRTPTTLAPGPSRSELEQKLFNAVGPEQRTEAEEILNIGRLSWRLRDDDNLLLGRLEAQLLEALNIAAKRLYESGRLAQPYEAVKEQHTSLIAAALDDPKQNAIVLPDSKLEKAKENKTTQEEKARQLVGQPAAPGMATGKVRIIENVSDLPHFQTGEILVCRAIEPTMTHLVPLACAIVELRGGMLIHGAIIARELGIPCVNGIPDVVVALHNGDLVTVDGYLGIVTVGTPEFDLEGVTLE